MSRSVAGSTASGGGPRSRYAPSEAGTDAGGARGKLIDIGDKVKKLVNADVEERFGDVGELVEEYPCALESGILRQGKMYVTNRFVCFYCSHFGQEKKIRIPYKQIVGVNKETTAKVFANAISIQTRQAEYMFRSFLRRDECHSLITAMWKNFKDIEKNGGHHNESAVSHSFEETEDKQAVVKIAYHDYSIQLIEVFVSPSPSGKKGHSFTLEVSRARDKAVSTVQVDFSVLKELHDALLDSNPSFGEYLKFPALNSGGFSGLSKITQAQIDERTDQLNKWMSGVMTTIAPGALIMSSSPPPYVISNAAVKDPNLHPLMPNEIKNDLADLLQISVLLLEPVVVQVPQDKSSGDITHVQIKAALESGGVINNGEVALEGDSASEKTSPELPKVSICVNRLAKAELMALSKKVLFQTEMQCGNHLYGIEKEFSDYRKLYEDLRMRGIGYDTLKDIVPDGGVSMSAAPLGPIDSSCSDSSAGDSVDSGFEAGQKQGEKKAKVKEIFGNLLASKPTRHGSFSEIEIEISLSSPFPRKFHTKLTSKDLTERCTGLDAWMRSMLMNYYKFSLEAKDIVNNFLGLGDTLEADHLMHLINIIDRITHAGAVSETSHHVAPVGLSGDSSHSDMTSLTAGTASNQKEGTANILKNAVAAIGEMVRPVRANHEAADKADQNDDSSAGSDDSSSMPAQSDGVSSAVGQVSVVDARAADSSDADSHAKGRDLITEALVPNPNIASGAAPKSKDPAEAESSGAAKNNHISNADDKITNATRAATVVNNNSVAGTPNTVPPIGENKIKTPETVQETPTKKTASTTHEKENDANQDTSAPAPKGCCVIS